MSRKPIKRPAKRRYTKRKPKPAARMIDLGSARVQIDYNGTIHTADAYAGRDLGDFVSDFAGFTQKNIAVPIESLCMTIFFRPDTTSDRFEVVFELGRADEPVPFNMSAYTAAIFIGATQLVSVAVPGHYWFSRWRWQSSVRPVVRSVADIPAGLLPPFRDAQKKRQPPTDGGGTPPAHTGVVVIEPMALAGVTPYMPSTGERDDIGLVTGPQGNWMDCYSAADGKLMMEQAEASGSIPWHIREPSTLGVYDCEAHPTATLYGQKPGMWEFIAQAPNPVTIDISHQPDLCFVPYLLTGDPYFLEEMQFAANHSTLAQPPDMRRAVVQTRGYAWQLRNVAQCAAVTPSAAPAGLLSRSQWVARLNAHRDYFTSIYLLSLDPVCSVLRTADNYAASRDEGEHNPAGTHTAPWQDEFMGCVFAWVVDLGFEDWRAIFDWQIGSTIARTSGASGWPREVSTPYRMNVCMSAGAPVATSWGEAWEMTSTLQGLAVAVPGEQNPGTDTWYLTYTRGSLAYAEKAGHDVAAALDWLDGELERFGVSLAPKWAVFPI